MKRKTAIFVIAWLSSIILTGVFVYAATPTTTFQIFGGNYPNAASFTVFTDGTNYFAKNELGSILYSGTDFDVVMQAAVSVLPSATADGGKIFIAAGEYEYDTEITVATTPSVFIEGEGHESTVLHYTGSGNAISFGDGTTFLWHGGVSDLTLQGDDEATSYGIYLERTSEIIIENVKIDGFATGICSDGRDDGGYWSSWNSVNLCEISGCPTGILFTNTSHANRVFESDITYDDSAGSIGIYIKDGSSNVILASDIENWDTAIKIDWSGNKIIGCHFESDVTWDVDASVAWAGTEISGCSGCNLINDNPSYTDELVVTGYMGSNPTIWGYKYATTTGDGTWIPHKMKDEPRSIQVTPFDASTPMVAWVKAVNSTHFQLGLTDVSGTPINTAETVYVLAWYVP